MTYWSCCRAKYLVAVGACMGITTGTLVGCMGVSRILVSGLCAQVCLGIVAAHSCTSPCTHACHQYFSCTWAPALVCHIQAAVCGQHMFLPFFGKISPRFNTPMASTAILCIATLPLAILSDLPALINLVRQLQALTCCLP